MATAQQAAGITQGLANVQSYIRNTPEREARRAEATARQTMAETKLNEFNANKQNRQDTSQLELDQLRLQVRQTQTTNLKSSTFDAFRMYDSAGDTKHLNTFLATAKANPVGSKMWGAWTRFDPLTRTSETEAMLGNHGITELDEFFSDPELVKSKVIATDPSGKHTMLDMNRLYQGTGYTAHMSAQNMATKLQTAQIENLMRKSKTKLTGSADTNIVYKIAEEEGLSIYEAAQMYFKAKIGGKKPNSKVERVAEQLRTDNPGLGYEASIRQAAQVTETRTSAAKNLDQAEDVRTNIDKVAGGNFFEADLNDPVVRRAVGPRITELEKLTGQELSSEDKRVVRSLRSLTALGSEAGEELTDEQTGIGDRLFRTVKSYMSNNLEGTEGVAAYETFRNTLIKAMSGATVTPTEQKALDRAMGTLGQQTGPVLTKLLTQMQDVRTQLETIYTLNDEYISRYYLGASLEDVDSTIEAIEDRVTYFKDYAEREQLLDETTISAVPSSKKSLDEIFAK